MIVTNKKNLEDMNIETALQLAMFSDFFIHKKISYTRKQFMQHVLRLPNVETLVNSKLWQLTIK